MPRRTAFSLHVVAACLALTACSSAEQLPTPRVAQPDAAFCRTIHRDTAMHLAEQLRAVDTLMAKRTGVYVLEEGDAALITRAWLSEYAERTIDVQYFIFSADNVGRIAVDYLVRAADRGVQVRVLVDDLLLEADADALLAIDSHRRIEVRIYNPGVNIGKTLAGKAATFARDFRGANQRMHNKTFTVDDRIVITGGRNIADEYFDYDHDYNFRDRDVLLLGGITSDVKRSFESFWTDSLSRPVSALVEHTSAVTPDSVFFAQLHAYACDPANYWPQVRERVAAIPAAFARIQTSGELAWVDSVRFISDVPGKNDGRSGLGGGGAALDTLAQLVRSARTSIDIQSPYLITTEIGRILLRDAVTRGVRVRILTNSLLSTDNLEAFSGYARDRDALLATGVKVFEVRPDASARLTIMTGSLQRTLTKAPIFGLHAKSMVIDGHVTVIGTFNMDPRSANLNTECVTVIYDTAIAARVTARMEEEFGADNAWETTREFNPDGQASALKRFKVWVRRVIPKSIL
jgi:cardiolipin synthase C